MLLPFQGANPNVHRPRALPWAGCLLAFQAVTPRIVYRTLINTKKFVLCSVERAPATGFTRHSMTNVSGNYNCGFSFGTSHLQV